MAAAEIIRLALIAAGNLRGLTSEQVEAGAQGAMRVRVVAAAALKQALGLSTREAREAVSLRHQNALLPSQLRSAGIQPEQIAEVAEAIRTGDLPPLGVRPLVAGQLGSHPSNSPWTPAVVEEMVRLWRTGLMHREIAQALTEQFGRTFTHHKVGQKLVRLGHVRSSGEVTARRAQNGRAAGEAAKKAKRFNPPVRVAKPKPEPKPEPSRRIAITDQDLIAGFLAERGPTRCPDRYAFGSSVPEYIGRSWKAV